MSPRAKEACASAPKEPSSAEKLYYELKRARDEGSLSDPSLYYLSKNAARDSFNERRGHVLSQTSALAQKDLLRSEIRAETVDREANSARVLERQRVLFERSCAQQGSLAAFDRAAASAGYVEAALASLSPAPAMRADGSASLHAKARGGAVAA